MVCRFCNHRQAVAGACASCGNSMSRYYCSICHLFDDEPGRDIYHCPSCNVCRRGKVRRQPASTQRIKPTALKLVPLQMCVGRVPSACEMTPGRNSQPRPPSSTRPEGSKSASLVPLNFPFDAREKNSFWEFQTRLGNFSIQACRKRSVGSYMGYWVVGGHCHAYDSTPAAAVKVATEAPTALFVASQGRPCRRSLQPLLSRCRQQPAAPIGRNPQSSACPWEEGRGGMCV